MLYGDAGQSVGIGVRGHTIEVWEVRNGKRTVLKTAAVKGKKTELKMKADNGYLIEFYWKENGKDWKELETGANDYNASFLPPWDRSPRPGLLHSGDASEPAVFQFFEIAYQ